MKRITCLILSFVIFLMSTLYISAVDFSEDHSEVDVVEEKRALSDSIPIDCLQTVLQISQNYDTIPPYNKN